MSDLLTVGGCALLSLTTSVDPGRWVGWDHELRVELQGGPACEAITLHLPPGTSLVELKGRARMFQDPSHRLDEHRLTPTLRPDGGVDVTLHLPELGTSDRADLRWSLHTVGFEPFRWQSAHPNGSLRLPRHVDVIEASGVEAQGRWRHATEPDARVWIAHPGQPEPPDPSSTVDRIGASDLSFLEATQRIGALPSLPSGWLIDRAPRGTQALDAGWVDGRTAGELVWALTQGGPDAVIPGVARPEGALLPHLVPALQIPEGPAPWWHPGLDQPETEVQLPNHDPVWLRASDAAAPRAPAAVQGRSEVRVVAEGPRLDRAFRQGLARTDTLTFSWSEAEQGPRAVRFALPAGLSAPDDLDVDCTASRVDAHSLTLVAARDRQTCSVTVHTTLSVPWGEAITPLAPIEEVTFRWRRPDGTEQTGLTHVRPSGFWAEALGDQILIDPRRGAAGWLTQVLREASMPEPGIPVHIRQESGWQGVIDLRSLVRARVHDLPERAHDRWRPRPLHAARRGGAMTPTEQAWLLALHLRQSRRVADVVFLTREQVPVPIGVVGAVVRVEDDGGVGWIDPQGDPERFTLPDGLQGLPGIGTGGRVRAPTSSQAPPAQEAP